MSEEATEPEAQPELMKGIMAAAGAAIAVGLIYGVVGMFVNEQVGNFRHESLLRGLA